MSKQDYKLIYIKRDCIGAGACEYAAPDIWFFDREISKATLKNPQTEKTEDVEELLFQADQEELEKYIESAEVCPVAVIQIFELKTGKRIFPAQ